MISVLKGLNLHLFWVLFIEGELLSITTNCTEYVSCLVEMFKMQLSITDILDQIYTDNLTFLGLITTDFGRQTKVSFGITLACASVSILNFVTQSFVWGETF